MKQPMRCPFQNKVLLEKTIVASFIGSYSALLNLVGLIVDSN